MRKKILQAWHLSVLALTLFALVGCGDSDNGFVLTDTTNVANTNAATAVNDTYTVEGNVLLTVQVNDGVLNNDTSNGATITAFDATSTNNGTVALNADGSFTYQPAAGFNNGADTFTYTLGTGTTASQATVTINVGDLIWFVNNTAAAGGNGTSSQPFNNLGAALAAAAANQTIFVFAGDGTSTGLTGPFTLQTGQVLRGEASGLLLTSGFSVAAGARPALRGPLTLANNSQLLSFQVTAPNAGQGINGNALSGVTLSNLDCDGEVNSGLIDVNLNGTLTLQDSFFTFGLNNGGVTIRVTGTNTGTLISQNNSFAAPSFFLAADTGNLTCTSTNDSGFLQVDTTDNAMVTSTVNNFGGQLSNTGSLSGQLTSNITGGQMLGLIFGVSDQCQITSTVTDVACNDVNVTSSFGPGAVEAPTLNLTCLRVTELGAGNGFWQFEPPQGANFVARLTDCVSENFNVVDMAATNICLALTGNNFGTQANTPVFASQATATFLVENLANVATVNNIPGTFVPAGTIVDGVCP